MDPKLLVAIAAAVIVVLIIAWAVSRKRRTMKLRSRFGPEYDRAVRESGPQRAETVLLDREKRVQEFPLRELNVDERERFVTEWRIVQSRFVDDPQAAVAEADLLIDRLMQARGYPTTDFEQRAEDISVRHSRVVANYRAAHHIAVRHRQGQASTEDLRNAIIYYRSLFDDLIHTGTNKKEVA